ncbi:hypothetical protein CEXT_84341 [Caerostris extrusa]|uniref:Uncharacterized protein n=1 Tax=Caerostris extrusa TaxID=172846 RepID=A0AAV4R6B5_CAEEX|nr:hypothetical protein CEXT_84341 [Caerostris extrusa]
MPNQHEEQTSLQRLPPRHLAPDRPAHCAALMSYLFPNEGTGGHSSALTPPLEPVFGRQADYSFDTLFLIEHALHQEVF